MRIEIDTSLNQTKTDFSWQFGMGNDHAATLLRTDVVEHIKYIHDELGIKYIRFHGIFDDDMLVYSTMGDNRRFKGVPHSKEIGGLNFHEVGLVYDNVLRAGLKPFVELSFMPLNMAKGKTIGFPHSRYDNNICLPKDYKQWERLIKEFVVFLIERYGKDEVESWPFEVWNEPDLGIFFDGKQVDYFKFYTVTVNAIKAIDDNIQVGGPSTSACMWIEDFINYCETNSVPYDFVSTHHYPGDGFGNSFEFKDIFKMLNVAKEAANNKASLASVYRDFFFNNESYKKWHRGVLKEFDDTLASKVKNKDIYMTEWNSMAVFGAPVHDEKYSAAFIVRTVMDLSNQIKGYMFWCMSDVFEEMAHLLDPFQGSFGIVTIDGIAKPNFWAFKILSMLFENRIETPKSGEGVEYSAFSNGQDLQVLLYNQNHDYYKNDLESVEIKVPFAAKEVFIYRIDDKHCNPKKYYLEKYNGKKNLTKKEALDIKEHTRLQREKLPFSIDGENTLVSLEFSTNDVALIEFIN